MYLPENIRYMRKYMNMSQDELAEKLGSSPIFRITQESPEIQGKLINPRVSGFLLLKYFSRFWVKIPHFVYIVYTKVYTNAHAC